MRNPFTLRARQRKAGAMKHRNAPRGGSQRALTLEVEGLTFVCPCGIEHEAGLPHRTTRVVFRVGLCPDCERRQGGVTQIQLGDADTMVTATEATVSGQVEF